MAIVNQTEVNDVDRDFRIVTGLELVPHFLLQLLFAPWLTGRVRRLRGGLQSERVGVLAVNAEHVAVDDDRVSATEGLRDVSLLALL